MTKKKDVSETKNYKPEKSWISIDNFGPLEDVHLAIKPINIFIGESGTGKSSLAKLIYIFNSLYREFHNYIIKSYNFPGIAHPDFPTLGIDKDIYKDPFIFITSSFLERFRNTFHIDTSQYESNVLFSYKENYSLNMSLRFILESSTGNYSEAQEILDYYNNILTQGNEKETTLNQSRINEYFKMKQNSFYQYNPIFIPAERDSVILASEGSFDTATISKDTILNDLYNAFRLYAGSEYFRTNVNTKNSEYQKQFWKLLRGQLFSTERELKFLLNSGDEIFLNQLSSGQKEILPIVPYLSKYYGDDNTFLFFEEPEAHIYPSMQKELLELLVLFQKSGKNNKLIITTHSPYILTALNNLIQADNTYLKNPKLKSEIEKIVPSDRWVSFDDVGVYYFRKSEEINPMNEVFNSSIKPLMDEEDRIILAEEIDKVSDVIGEEFNKLLDIEFGEK